MFLVGLVSTLLCYNSVSSEAPRNLPPLSEIQQWNKQVIRNADRDGLDNFLFSLYVETDTFFQGFYHHLNDKEERKVQCGEILNETHYSDKTRVFVEIQSLGFIKWRTTVGIQIPGEPVQCKSILGYQPLIDFLKSINKGNCSYTGLFCFPFYGMQNWCKDLLLPYLQFISGTRSKSLFEYKDYANCNLCLTEREWIFIAIACVVLALCIQNIVLSRLRRERIRIHNTVSETLKLPQRLQN